MIGSVAASWLSAHGIVLLNVELICRRVLVCTSHVLAREVGGFCVLWVVPYPQYTKLCILSHSQVVWEWVHNIGVLSTAWVQKHNEGSHARCIAIRLN